MNVTGIVDGVELYDECYPGRVVMMRDCLQCKLYDDVCYDVNS